MLTFQELISVPLFSNAVIVGGWEGKERNFSYIVDNPTDVIESSLLLLPAKREQLENLTLLSNPKVKGFIFYGAENDAVPYPLKEMIKDYDKPVLMIKETNVHTIKKCIEDLIKLKSMGQFHYVWEGMTDYWITLVHQGSLERMFQRLRLFVHEELYLLNSDFSPHFSAENGLTEQERKEIRDLYNQHDRKKESMLMLQGDTRFYLMLPLAIEEKILGFVVLKDKPGLMIDTCSEIVSKAIPAIITGLKLKEAILKTHQTYKDNFLYNLLYNNIESEQMLIKLGKQWDWDFTKPAHLMVVKIQSVHGHSLKKGELEQFMGTIRSVIAANFLKGITYEIQGNIVIILFDHTERPEKERKKFMISVAKSIVEEIEKLHPQIACRIGIGRSYPTNMKLYKSFFEGKVALELGKYELQQQAVWHFDNIGIGKLLANIENDLLHEFYKEVLGELISFDEEKDNDYIETLQQFFQNNGDINKTATELFVHPNTLRKRLKKIESILNCDLNQIDDQLKIVVALKIMKMLT